MAIELMTCGELDSFWPWSFAHSRSMADWTTWLSNLINLEVGKTSPSTWLSFLTPGSDCPLRPPCGTGVSLKTKSLGYQERCEWAFLKLSQGSHCPPSSVGPYTTEGQGNVLCSFHILVINWCGWPPMPLIDSDSACVGLQEKWLILVHGFRGSGPQSSGALLRSSCEADHGGERVWQINTAYLVNQEARWGRGRSGGLTVLSGACPQWLKDFPLGHSTLSSTISQQFPGDQSFNTWPCEGPLSQTIAGRQFRQDNRPHHFKNFPLVS